jgi:hypothetical protein
LENLPIITNQDRLIYDRLQDFGRDLFASIATYNPKIKAEAGQHLTQYASQLDFTSLTHTNRRVLIRRKQGFGLPLTSEEIAFAEKFHMFPPSKPY